MFKKTLKKCPKKQNMFNYFYDNHLVIVKLFSPENYQVT